MMNKHSVNRILLNNKYFEKKNIIKYKELKKLKYEEFEKTEKISSLKKFQCLYKKYPFIKIKNKCWKTENTRSTYRMFNLSRHSLRLLSHECLLPGIIKSSW